jgi:hypothetical protein
VHLDAGVAPRLRAGRALEGVRSVTLRRPITIDGLRSPSKVDQPQVSTWPLVDFVRRLMPSNGDLLTILSAQDAELAEDVEISFEIRRRGRIREGRSLIDEIASVVSNSDDLSFELDVPSLGTVTSGELKLSAQHSLAFVDGTPALTNVAQVMLEWLGTLIANRSVSE